MGLGRVLVWRNVRTRSSLLHACDRRLRLGFWAQPSAMLFLRTSALFSNVIDCMKNMASSCFALVSKSSLSTCAPRLLSSSELLANVNMLHWLGRRRVEHPSNLVVRAAADAAQRQRRVRGTSYDRLDVDLSATCSSSMSRMEACCASPEHALGFLHLALLCDLWWQTVPAVGYALFPAACFGPLLAELFLFFFFLVCRPSC